MRVVINEAHIKRYQTFSHVLFMVSLVGMVGGFIYTMTSKSTNSNSLSCLLLPGLLFMTLLSVRMANMWIREPRPQNVLGEALKGLGKRYSLFHYLLPARHVLIGPEGVFTITIIWQERVYRVKGKRWSTVGGMMTGLASFMRQDSVGNPFRDALFDAQSVQRVLNKIAPDSGVKVQPLIVLISPKVAAEIEDPIIPVLYADPKKKPSLRQYLIQQKSEPRTTLSLEALDRIDQLYGLVTRQELESMGVQTDEGEEGDEETEGAAPESLEAKGGQPGSVYVAQAGQLYIFGVTQDPVEDWLNHLKTEGAQDVQLVHTIETDEPGALKTRLHSKFARKRQKGEWFGLSKKDITWLMSIKGEPQEES
jgi:hypothetical protein